MLYTPLIIKNEFNFQNSNFYNNNNIIESKENQIKISKEKTFQNKRSNKNNINNEMKMRKNEWKIWNHNYKIFTSNLWKVSVIKKWKKR